MTRRLPIALAGVLLGGALTLAGPAQPADAAPSDGTIVYIQDHNVWLAKLDGSGRHQVTHGGSAAAPYAGPSMSDQGLIAVQRGGSIEVLQQNGAVVNRLSPPSSFIEGSCSTMSVTPALEPTISPDGSRIAYYQVRLSNCAGSLKTDALSTVVDTLPTGPGTYEVVIGSSPAWVSNERLVLRQGSTIALFPLGYGDPDGVAWFTSTEVCAGCYNDLLDPATSRDGTLVAVGIDAVWDDATDQSLGYLGVLPTSGDPRSATPPPPPGEGCFGAAAEPRPDDGPILDSITISADGSAIVYREGADIWVNTVAIGDCAASTGTKVITGASDPYWSPAPIAPPAVPGGTGPGGKGPGGAGSGQPTVPAGTSTVTLPGGRTVQMFDDRAFKAKKFKARKGARYAKRTAMVTRAHRATLTRAGVPGGKLSLVASKGPRHGTVAVFYGKKKLRTVKLSAPKLRHQRLIRLGSVPSTKKATVRIQVTSRGRTVIIDGLAIG